MLCTSAPHLDFKAPKKELLYEAGLLAHYCKHSVRDKTNLKAVDTRTPTHLHDQFVLLDLLAHRSAKMLIRLPSAYRGRTAVQFPPIAPIRVVLSWHSKERFVLALAGKGL